MLHKIFTTFIFLIVFGSLHAKIINVPADQSTIQTGINAAVDGDTVLVAENTYLENINFKGKAITVASHFLVDGDTTHINNTIVDGSQPSHPDSGSVVFFVSEEDTTSMICGFTITGGTGTISDGNYRVGGGIFCYNSGARVSNNHVMNNSISHSFKGVGGGFSSFPYSNQKISVIENNLFQDNTIEADIAAAGGAIHVTQGRIDSNVIQANKLNSSNGISEGGGIFGTSSNSMQIPYFVQIRGNVIQKNETVAGSVGTQCAGGGIDLVWGTRFIIANNIISQNIVSHPGGNVWGSGIRIHQSTESQIQKNTISFNDVKSGQCWGGGLSLYETTGVTIEDNHIEGNKARNGAGLWKYGQPANSVKKSDQLAQENYSLNSAKFNFDSMDLIRNNRFIDNQATDRGGGVYSRNSNLTMTNNIFSQNKAVTGGGIAVEKIGDDQWGDYDIINNTITENSGTDGSGIACKTVTATIKNNIVWNNKGGKQILNDMPDGTVIVSYSDIQGGQEGVNTLGNSVLIWQDGNIDADPLFVDTDSCCLSANSPCKNTGDPDPMYNDDDGSRNDMGAYGGPVISGIKSRESAINIPQLFTLRQNYPNPFNPSTTINYELPHIAQIKIVIYDMLGRPIKQLVNEQKQAGQHSAIWNGRNDFGEPAATGLYFCKMEADGFVEVIKLALVK